MRMHNYPAALAALSALVAPVVLAQQTTMQLWFPMMDPAATEDIYADQEIVIKTIVNQATVVEMRCKDKENTECVVVPFTIGQSTFRFTAAEVTESLGYGGPPDLIDCKLTGCPTATTGACSVVINAGYAKSETNLLTTSLPLDTELLRFRPIALATPLPEADSIQCDSQAAASTTPSATGGKSAETSAETSASASSTESSGWKVAASWPGVAAVAALSLLI